MNDLLQNKLLQNKLVQQRCAIHLSREAAARCPECSRFYCRECVTEHEGRMICTVCVERLAAAVVREKSSRGALWAGLSAGGLMLTWAIFYYLGAALAAIPSTFHSGGTP